ncbi:DUF3343 domain-containing protein [Desulfovibrio sp. OttesenSCG-928-C06]|nr:DUF3343 domain-containing protein [Desulfovibrio sp. OttesenSCG-928-C06]
MGFFDKLLHGLSGTGQRKNGLGSGQGRSGGKLPERAGRTGSAERSGRGILVFEQTGDVIQAEKALKKAGFAIAVKAPPPVLRTGCDLVIEYQLVLEPGIRAILAEKRLKPLQYYQVADELLEPVSIFHRNDYGEYLMVRAANMKITVQKSNLRIVNVSGGGCPDVPYLASLLMNRKLDEAQPLLDIGQQTLCGYALQLAFNEARTALCA